MMYEDENEDNLNDVSEYNPYANMNSFEDGEEINVPDEQDDEQIPVFNSQNSDEDDEPFENPSFVDYEDDPDKQEQINHDKDDVNEGEQDNENDEGDEGEQDNENDENDEGDEGDEQGGIENFYERKISPEEAEGSSKPKQINKRFLSIAIICVLGSVFIIAFLMPTNNKKKEEEKNRKIAEKSNLANYEAMAEYQGYPLDDSTIEIQQVDHYYDDFYEEEVEIPPVVQENQNQKQTYQNTASSGGGGGGGGGTTIPDTRNDALQAKTISGIKGLTSTQQRYSTDYAQQVEQNVASTQRQNSLSMPSKDEYMASMLNAYSGLYSNPNANNAYATQNDQSGKNSFYNNGRNDGTVGQGTWLDYNTIWQGTIIEATLASEINTDLPGEIQARVAKNVYSSQDGRFLLIPQNSILYGSYNSSISYAQKRVQVGWHTLIRPDGYQVNLGNMNATDAKGASGIKGFVNDHPLAYLKAIGLMSVFSIVNSEFQASMAQTTNPYIQNIYANTQQITNELGEKLIDRAMNVQPTITIKAGTKINVVASQNLVLPPVEEIPVTQSYRRY